MNSSIAPQRAATQLGFDHSFLVFARQTGEFIMLMSRRLAYGFASSSTLALAIAAGCGSAFAAVAADTDINAPEVQAIIVTASKGKAEAVAPVSSSLKATEPTAIITRKFIEESAPRVGDYTTTAILAPSVATTPNPNGPGATDGAKITLRGFQDGEYNTTYDGIAWGDTNGPTHHATSFFPSSVIGGVVIDRGPGRASDLGQANFGGSVNLYSLPLEDRAGLQQTLTYGSFGTVQGVTTFESGPIADWHDANFVANFMEYKTDGYLSNSPSNGSNMFFKGAVPITSKITLTGLFTRNEDQYNEGDAESEADVAQTTLYGKRFALSNDPTLATYKGYNDTHKQTDFEYIRLNADLDHGFKAENTVYSYFYSKNTLSASNDGADNSLGAVALAAANKVTLTPGAIYPVGGKTYATTLQTYGIPGYTKRNEYRVIGDIIKFTKDFDFGELTFGTEYESAFTQRQRFDVDLLNGDTNYDQKAPLFPGSSGCGNLATQTTGKAGTGLGTCEVPLNIAYSEFSGWHQYQPFVEFDWKPIEGLTVTPGVKYVNFDLFVHAPELAVKGSIQPSYNDQDFTKTLPFLTANYRIRSNVSVYAEYAQGFLVPNVSSYYVNTPTSSKVIPQESTNYQLGTVFNAGDFGFDGDVYYIDFKHKIQSATEAGETYETNSGGATYKGVELQATYVLPYGFSAFGNYSINDATANGDPINPGGNGKQLAKVPRWTSAIGLRSQLSSLFTDGDGLVSSVNTKWIGQQTQTAASGTVGPTNEINSFNQTDFSTTYHLGHFALEFQLLNIFDNESITSSDKGNSLITGTNRAATTIAEGGALNLFTYQTGRSFQLTLKAAF